MVGYDPQEEEAHDDSISESNQPEELEAISGTNEGSNPLGLIPVHQDSAERMGLTEDEINLAINVKEAIAAAPHVDPVTDFMCVQLALYDGDDTETAIERAYHLQCFREEYGILDSVADARKRLGAMIDLMPGLYLNLTMDESLGQPMLVFDNTKFDPKKIRSEENLRFWLGSVYYTLASFAPDFETIRQGLVLLLECEGYDWKRHASLDTTKRMYSEIVSHYPVILSRIKYFNSGTMMHAMLSMLKPVLPKNVRNRIDLGCRFEHRLDEVYLVPNLDQANQRVINEMTASLERRYHNEQAFRL